MMMGSCRKGILICEPSPTTLSDTPKILSKMTALVPPSTATIRNRGTEWEDVISHATKHVRKMWKVKWSEVKEEKKEKKCLPSYKLNSKNVPKPAAAKPRLRTIFAPRSIYTYVEWMSPMVRHSSEVLSFCFSFSLVAVVAVVHSCSGG